MSTKRQRLTTEKTIASLRLPFDIFGVILSYTWEAQYHRDLVRVCKMFSLLINSTYFFEQNREISYFPCLRVMKIFSSLKYSLRVSQLEKTRDVILKSVKSQLPFQITNEPLSEWKIGLLVCLPEYHKLLVCFDLGFYTLSTFSNVNLVWKALAGLLDMWKLANILILKDDFDKCPEDYKDRILSDFDYYLERVLFRYIMDKTSIIDYVWSTKEGRHRLLSKLHGRTPKHEVFRSYLFGLVKSTIARLSKENKLEELKELVYLIVCNIRTDEGAKMEEWVEYIIEYAEPSAFLVPCLLAYPNRYRTRYIRKHGFQVCLENGIQPTDEIILERATKWEDLFLHLSLNSKRFHPLTERGKLIRSSRFWDIKNKEFIARWLDLMLANTRDGDYEPTTEVLAELGYTIDITHLFIQIQDLRFEEIYSILYSLFGSLIRYSEKLRLDGTKFNLIKEDIWKVIAYLLTKSLGSRSNRKDENFEKLQNYVQVNKILPSSS